MGDILEACEATCNVSVLPTQNLTIVSCILQRETFAVSAAL